MMNRLLTHHYLACLTGRAHHIICIFLLSFLMTMAQTTGFSLPVKEQNGEELTCSMQDSEGYWWYGGKGTGLCRFDGYETVSFRSDRQHPDLLRSNDVLCMTEQKDNAEIWFGTREGAYILSKKDYTVRPIVLKSTQEDNELADKRITCMLTEANGSVWLAYRNQLLHFSANSELIERFETTWEGKNRSVLSFCFDADSTLWAGLWNGGVVYLKMDNGRRLMFNAQWTDYPNDPTTHLPDDQTTKLMLDSVMGELAPSNDTTVLSWVRTLSPLEKSQKEAFYIGTYHSLYRYDGQQVMQLQTDLDKVRSMAYSENSNTLYLLSKARGVCQWKDDKLEVLLDSTQFRQLQLQGDTALLLSEGVGGVNMLNLHTMKLMADTTTADVHPVVTAYTINGTKQLMAYGQQVLTLPKGTDLVEIYLSTLDFDHAPQVQFAYRLNEKDKWTELSEGEHIVKIAHMPSGESQLQVRATDTYGRWSAPTTVLTIVRPAVWYEYTWLWVFLAAVFFAGGFFLLRRRRKTTTMEAIAPTENAESSVDSVPSESSVPSALPVADQEFLDKAIAAVSAHIIDSDYSVDALASDLCMSRASLHRRMRAISGQTPTEFIRNQRLERAAHLLRTTSHSVNEISDLVGFSYASYFTKCFKEKYGMLPKDY